MSRLRTIFFWSFVSVALGAGVYAYINLKNSKKPKLNAISVLPDSCYAYFNTTDLSELNKKINSQSLIFDQLNSIPEVDLAINTIQELDSIVHSNEILSEAISNSRIHLAYYNKGWLLAFNLKELGQQEQFDGFLRDSLKLSLVSQNVFGFQTRQHKKLYLQLYDGVVLISNNQALLAKSLSSSNKKLEKNPAFISYKSSLMEENLLSVYVNHDLYETHHSKKTLDINYILKKGTSAASFDFQPSQVVMNGYFSPGPEEIMQSFNDQRMQKSKTLSEYLPASVISFKAYGFSSYALLRQKLDLTFPNQNYWEKINKEALFNLKNEFERNVGSHILQFKTAFDKSKLVVLEIQDTILAAEHLSIMSDTIWIQDSLKLYQLDTLNSLQLFNPLFNSKSTFAAILFSHIYFSESKEVLFECVNNLRQGSRLNNLMSFQAYQNQHFPDDFNYLIYNSPQLVKEDIPSFFNFEKSGNKDPFQHLKHFSFSASHNLGNFKFRMQLMYEPENKSTDEQFLWTLQLDTNAIMTAQAFVNHSTKENELLIQDSRHSLYLINAKGNILWKKKLAEKIQSKIYLVDIYKNGKFQMLFNTKSALHLIDRNGNYVEAYPTKLPAEASNTMSLFDYENDKEYRILIACKNNMIYNYNIHGQKQEKFVSVKTDDEIQLPIKYVKIGLSDYLVAVDVEGKIYTFSRRGLGRIGLRNRTIVNCKSFYCDLNNSISSSYLVYVDDKSKHLNKISFDDRKEIVNLDAELESANIKFSLIDENRNMDLLVTKDKSIWAFNFTGNLIHEVKFTDDIIESEYYKDESHSFYYSLSEDRKELYLQNLVNLKMQKYKATLLPAVSNLFKDNKTYLILSDGAQLSCVPVN